MSTDYYYQIRRRRPNNLKQLTGNLSNHALAFLRPGCQLSLGDSGLEAEENCSVGEFSECLPAAHDQFLHGECILWAAIDLPMW